MNLVKTTLLGSLIGGGLGANTVIIVVSMFSIHSNVNWIEMGFIGGAIVGAAISIILSFNKNSANENEESAVDHLENLFSDNRVNGTDMA